MVGRHGLEWSARDDAHLPSGDREVPDKRRGRTDELDSAAVWVNPRRGDLGSDDAGTQECCSLEVDRSIKGAERESDDAASGGAHCLST